MKAIKKILVIIIIMLCTSTSYVNAKAVEIFAADSINLLAEFSLFWEYQKNKDYKSAESHGWRVLNTNPKDFLQYKPFRKMEEVVWYLHDSVATSDEEIYKIADTTLYLYDLAVKSGAKNPEYFYVRKAYVMEIWTESDVDAIVAAYEEAFNQYKDFDAFKIFYMDRLGNLYAQNATDENGWKLKALDLYSKLSEVEPENALWISRIDALAENIDELVDIRKKAWDLDKQNLEKAYTYAETCIKAQNYERSIEPLEFLVSNSPEVINYWRKLASSYTKLEKNDNAIKAYKTLIQLEPNNRENYFNIALIYQKIGQLSVARSYLQKAIDASSEPWDLPIYFEAQLYEQAARNCGFEFMDKCVYQLAVETYRKAASLNGPQSNSARERILALANSVPQAEDYFFRKLRSGTQIKIEGKCYEWINRSITIP